jgi:hypothetical protein
VQWVARPRRFDGWFLVGSGVGRGKEFEAVTLVRLAGNRSVDREAVLVGREGLGDGLGARQVRVLEGENAAPGVGSATIKSRSGEPDVAPAP